MKKVALYLFGVLLAAAQFSSSALTIPPRLYTVEVSANIQRSPATIHLRWPADSYAVSYSVSRKAPGSTTWTLIANLPGTATEFIDSAISLGAAYEYGILKQTSVGYAGSGYIYTGIDAPFVEFRGTVILIVDSTWASHLAPELHRLQMDLVGDGWSVLRYDVARTTPVPSVKSIIQSAAAQSGPGDIALFLFGHVPVPYSGDFAADSHDNHRGAWPADVYYGDLDGVWTDITVNRTTAEKWWNHNVPGDGKFDQSNIPSDVDIMVGRVDLFHMTCFANKTPSRDELTLLRQYLNKDHRFRHGQLPLPRRGLIIDNFGGDKEALASTGWRNFGPLFGHETTVEATWGNFFPTLQNEGFLWSYGTGGGGYYTCAGVGSSDDFAIYDIKTVFTFFFGSYFGDWDNESNFLRAPLGSTTYTLTSAYGGRPHWFVHHMALGYPIGYSTRITQNNYGPGEYEPENYGVREVHTALHGDPTLRLHPVIPPSNLTISGGSGMNLSWTASPDTAIQGYLVYRSDNDFGPYTRISGTHLVTGTSFNDPQGTAATVYMVRAVKLESSASGTYYNPSQGIFARAVALPAAPSGVTATASTGKITVSWQDNSSDETSFNVYRRSPSDNVFVLRATTGANITSYDDTSVSPGSTYYYEVTAVNDAGESPRSPTAAATTPGGSNAILVRQDTSTGGNWKGVYGLQGYNIIQNSANYPSYVSVSTVGNSTWVWNYTTSDPAALLRATDDTRLAACWYSNTSYDIRFAFNDGATHRVAIYCIDWDNNNRRQLIDVIDADANTLISTHTLESFQKGIYMIWDMKGRVTLRLRPLSGNVVVSGIFFDSTGTIPSVSPVTFDPAGGTYEESVIVSMSSGTSGASIYYTTDGSAPTTSSTLYTGPVTLTSSVTLSARAVKAGMNDSSVTTATFTVTQPAPPPPPPPSGASVVFHGVNTTRSGTWKGAVGTEGYQIIADSKSIPRYATVDPSGQSQWIWQYSTSDTRALQRNTSAARMAACWYSPTSFDVELILDDGAPHGVSFYCLDWDNGGRQQQVDIIDHASGQVLHTQLLSGFSGGAYLEYNIQGHVIVRFTRITSHNAVVSGIFFDPPR